jgi:hypothetical protein
MFDIIERAPDDVLVEVRGKLAALLGMDVGAVSGGPEGV